MTVPLLSDCLAETFPDGARKPRHDGWTPQAVAGFLEALAATGIVEHAARAVGRSAQSAYNFRNRRQGRAFAKMWDAVLVHRSRARVAADLQGRSIAGCVSMRKKDGVVVGEYHYYDNRLAMSVLTRLDRLAEGQADNDTHLRALSEDLDAFLECVAEGGDLDRFVDERRPAAPAPIPDAPGTASGPDPEAAFFAGWFASGPKSDYFDDNQLRDLDPTCLDEWTAEEWQHAHASGFLGWLALDSESIGWTDGPDAPLRFLMAGRGARAAADRGDGTVPAPSADAGIDNSDLDPSEIWYWGPDKHARAWTSGFLRRLPDSFWNDLAEAEANDEPDE